MPPPSDPVSGSEALEAEGFMPLWPLPMTWATIWMDWPPEHRRSVPESRPEWWAPGPQRSGNGSDAWFIRSPWPTVTMPDVMRVLHRRIVRYSDWETNPARAREVSRAVLSWNEADVVASVLDDRRGE